MGTMDMEKDRQLVKAVWPEWELAELIGMADRIIIMKDFQVTKEFERSPELSEADIIEYMI